MHTHSPIPVPPWSPAAQSGIAPGSSPGAFGNRVIGSPWWPVIPSACNALPPSWAVCPGWPPIFPAAKLSTAVAAWAGDTFQGSTCW